jgi:hypothetical protein
MTPMPGCPSVVLAAILSCHLGMTGVAPFGASNTWRWLASRCWAIRSIANGTSRSAVGDARLALCPAGSGTVPSAGIGRGLLRRKSVSASEPV